MAPLPQGISTRPIILTPLEALSVTEPNRQWTGRGRQSQAEGDPVRVWWIFAALPRHPAGASKRRIWCAALFLRAAKPSEAATNWIACSSKQMAESQAQTLSDIAIYHCSSQEAQNQHTQRPASDNIRAGFKSFTNNISKGRS